MNNFSEHPVDHVTYAKKIALSKNIVLFISCFYYAFYSFFLYNAHVIFTYFRVKGIVSTVNLDGIKSYKEGIRAFIVYDILILISIIIDFALKLYKFIKFKRNQNIINNI